MSISNENIINIPNFLIGILNKQYNDEDIKKILDGFNKKRFVSIRVNTIKTDSDTIKNNLNNNGIEIDDVSWSKDVLIIKNASEKEIEKLDIYKNGFIYMQSLSSILPPIILNPKENTDILDMCAAPRW